MKPNPNSLILLVVTSILILSGCVTQKKYDELLSENVKMEGQIDDLTNKLEIANKKIEELNQQLEEMSDSKFLTQNQLKETTEKLQFMTSEKDKLQTLYDNLLKNSGKLNRDLAAQQERLLSIEQNLEEATKKNDELTASLEEREKKVGELEKILAEKEQAVNDLKNKVSNALLNFKENDLTVEVRNGKVYVSLAEQLLFKSGSILVDPKGVSALQQLASALKDSPDINVMVEGHTDDVPISRKSQYMNDNWDLSVLRATSIVKILTNAGVSPGQVTATGKGEYSPVMDNDSDENKQKNRRTEIILTPKLDELFQILESN
jgi:chemotaxis protein MotB